MEGSHVRAIAPEHEGHGQPLEEGGRKVRPHLIPPQEHVHVGEHEVGCGGHLMGRDTRTKLSMSISCQVMSRHVMSFHHPLKNTSMYASSTRPDVPAICSNMSDAHHEDKRVHV